MASFHLTAKIGGPGKAAAHAQYISRVGKYERNREAASHIEHGNLPAWSAHDPLEFWSAADQYERKGGSTYREFEIALPRELNLKQQIELVREEVKAELGDRFVYTWAIHIPDAGIEGGEQPHAHIMYSQRELDVFERDPDQFFKRYNSAVPAKGGCKKASGGKTKDENVAALVAERGRYAALQNAHLAKLGYTARVDHRSLKVQGIIDRKPEKHLGAEYVNKMKPEERRELLSLRENNRAIDKENEALREARQALEKAEQTSRELIADFKAELAEQYEKARRLTESTIAKMTAWEQRAKQQKGINEKVSAKATSQHTSTASTQETEPHTAQNEPVPVAPISEMATHISDVIPVSDPEPPRLPRLKRRMR